MQTAIEVKKDMKAYLDVFFEGKDARYTLRASNKQGAVLVETFKEDQSLSGCTSSWDWLFYTDDSREVAERKLEKLEKWVLS